MPDSWDRERVLQQTADIIAASIEMCDAADHGETWIIRHIVVSRQVIARSMALIENINRRLY